MPQQRLARSWGTRFDSLTSSDPLSSNRESIVAGSHRASPPPRSASVDGGSSLQDAHEPIVQDASIFIGSLPSNMDYTELTAMLSQHLSGHPQVKGIKVVRDSKGGACAFIQCQDSEAASVLMNDLRVAAPQPFLGRYLRYEPARASKTLFISYRSPRQYIRPRDTSRKSDLLPSEEPRFIDLQLPNAMRIIRFPGNKHFTILYNSYALATPPNGGVDPGLLLVPVLCDAETLFRVASAFGPVDYFGPYAHANENGQLPLNFPPPHDGARLPVMDHGCWRVKWEHRDDCVSALMTLRRIPHLTVTWAHQSHVSPREHGFYGSLHPSPLLQASYSWRGRGAGSALRSASRFIPASHTLPSFRTTGDTSVIEHLSVTKVAEPTSGRNVWKQESPSESSNGNVLLSKPSRPRALSLTHDRPQPAVALPSRESTGQLSFTNWESTNRNRCANQMGSAGIKSSPILAGRNLTSSSPYPLHHMTSSDSGCHTSQESDNQEIDASVPHTPDFGTSPITPITPGSLMLRTPTTASYMGDFQSMSFRDYESLGSLSQLSQEKRDEFHAVDPTTIFVGGLEMFGPGAWDEGKVRALFSKYGGIETIKFIRPSNKRSAFAFVKFNNIEAPAKAVKAEHNRILDGRLIRVQLRDWNPTYRPNWRPGSNKPQALGASDDFGVDPKPPKPGIIHVATQMADLKPTDSPAQRTPPSSAETTCDLNEVQEGTGIPPSRVSPTANDQEYDPAKDSRRIEKALDLKQGETAATDTTPLSCQTSMVPAATLPGTYSVPTIQYYQGWFPNYAPHFSFQPPFAGQPYPGYPLPPPTAPVPPQSGGPDGSVTPSYQPIPFGPAGAAYPTFMPYPPPVGHGCDVSQANAIHQGVANNPALLHTQAPLVPTGFIQGDQGILVPVYPPDALNQYMTGNQDQRQAPAPANSGSAEGQPPLAWRPYPPPPVRPQTVVFHPYINPPLTAPPPQPLGPPAWIPGHAWQGVPAQSGNSHGIAARRISSSPVGGPGAIPMGSSFERSFVPPRRQYRRDIHSQHHKHNFTRGATGRFGKTCLEAPRSPPNNQAVSNSQVAVPDASIDGHWQSWNTDQANST